MAAVAAGGELEAEGSLGHTPRCALQEKRPAALTDPVMLEQTTVALDYATRARRIKTNAKQRVDESESSELHRLRRQIVELQVRHISYGILVMAY